MDTFHNIWVLGTGCNFSQTSYWVPWPTSQTVIFFPAFLAVDTPFIFICRAWPQTLLSAIFSGYVFYEIRLSLTRELHPFLRSEPVKHGLT